MKRNFDNLFLTVLTVTSALFLWLLISHNVNVTNSHAGNTFSISISYASQLQNFPPHLSLLLMFFSDWSKEVSKSCLLWPIHLFRHLAFWCLECTEAKKVIGYLAKFASAKMQKVASLLEKVIGYLQNMSQKFALSGVVY